ncbi:hypothetical protein BIW11_10800, partial [Tropilaelaps mercedesae]
GLCGATDEVSEDDRCHDNVTGTTSAPSYDLASIDSCGNAFDDLHRRALPSTDHSLSGDPTTLGGPPLQTVASNRVTAVMTTRQCDKGGTLSFVGTGPYPGVRKNSDLTSFASGNNGENGSKESCV